MTFDEEITFWEREAAAATKRELAMFALGMAAGLKRAHGNAKSDLAKTKIGKP